ncbi:VOC family protein [Trinickia sp. LjRoot230]|uniref:VOC family protein n=1 Tax=Trinickia sp. LjRoot230 TaxID=3342288 RepID=UPI003ED12A17
MTAATATATRVLAWFEIPAMDFERAVRFYEAALDTELPREVVGGVPMALFAHADEAATGGCIIHNPAQLRPAEPGAGALVYLHAEPSLQAALARVERAGGTRDGTLVELPNNYGYIGFFIDTEGNRVGLHSPNLR